MFFRLPPQPNNHSPHLSESHRSFSNKRSVVPYSHNATCSLAVQELDKGFEAAQLESRYPGEGMLMLVKLHATAIREHAARRTDLYFYLMIAMHGLAHRILQPVQIVRVGAQLQHGYGSIKQLTQGCHSSMPANIAIMNRLLPRFTLPVTEQFRRTHLYQSMNSVVELPIIVNRFDSYLEGSAHMSIVFLHLMMVLNQVANNQIDPITGLDLYYKMMRTFFDGDHVKYFRETDTPAMRLAKQLVCKEEQAGTFAGANSRSKSRADFIAMLLRSSVCHLKSRSDVLERCRMVQNEVWGAGANFKNR